MRDKLQLMMLTSNPDVAVIAENAGVDRIFLDLEYINKYERQKGRNTLISHNSIEDTAKLRKVVKNSKLIVRVNPINPNSEEEIDKVIDYGADMLMLPMALDADDVKRFVDFAGGRVKTVPMIETAQAMARLDDILNVSGVDELFIGLNDLHISMGLTFMFELLSGGLVDYMAEKIKDKGIPFGFGGIAKIGEGELPAQDILAEHYRLGSSGVILSRTFRNEIGKNVGAKINFSSEIKKIRDKEDELSAWSCEQFQQNSNNIKSIVNSIVGRISSQRGEE